MDNKPEIISNCKGQTLKLTHPRIRVDEEYQILAYKEIDGKYGTFFILYCYLPKLKIYQRVFSNNKLTDYVDGHPLTRNYEMWEDSMIYVHQRRKPMMFYPGNVSSFNGNEYRRIDVDE